MTEAAPFRLSIACRPNAHFDAASIENVTKCILVRTFFFSYRMTIWQSLWYFGMTSSGGRLLPDKTSFIMFIETAKQKIRIMPKCINGKSPYWKFKFVWNSKTFYKRFILKQSKIELYNRILAKIKQYVDNEINQDNFRARSLAIYL